MEDETFAGFLCLKHYTDLPASSDLKTLRNIKNRQRSQCLAARRELSSAEREAYSHAICQTLTTLKAAIRAETIFSYMATWDEVDLIRDSQVALEVKNLPANSGDARDAGSIFGSGRSPGIGNGNPLQYPYLEHPMDRGACWATTHGVAESHRTEHACIRVSTDLTFQVPMQYCS